MQSRNCFEYNVTNLKEHTATENPKAWQAKNAVDCVIPKTVCLKSFLDGILPLIKSAN